MAKDDNQLTAAEMEFLDRLRSVAETTASLVNIQNSRKAGLVDRDTELTSLRRQLIELKEENQHLKELMNTWKERMGTFMSQINNLK